MRGPAALLSALALVASACIPDRRPATAMAARGRLDQIDRWWILIGHAEGLETVDWHRAAHDAQMVVLSGDPRIKLDDFPRATVRLAYLSVGEADANRGYWHAVQNHSFLIEPNPDWPQGLRVDLRDKRWQEVLLGEEAPRLLGLGFQGFMLDTLDTAPYLEAKDPVRFAGSRQALRELLRNLRAAYPQAVIIANGTAALADAAPYVDAYVVEGVFATYDFGHRVYRPTTDGERAWKLDQIAHAEAVAQRPVFTIEYADFGDVDLGRWAAAESARHGFHPYVAVKDLNAVP